MMCDILVQSNGLILALQRFATLIYFYRGVFQLDCLDPGMIREACGQIEFYAGKTKPHTRVIFTLCTILYLFLHKVTFSQMISSMNAFITSKKELIADGIEPMPLSSEDNHSTRYQSPRQKRNTMSLRLKIAVSGVNQSVIKVRK